MVPVTWELRIWVARVVTAVLAAGVRAAEFKANRTSDLSTSCCPAWTWGTDLGASVAMTGSEVGAVAVGVGAGLVVVALGVLVDVGDDAGWSAAKEGCEDPCRQVKNTISSSTGTVVKATRLRRDPLVFGGAPSPLAGPPDGFDPEARPGHRLDDFLALVGMPASEAGVSCPAVGLGASMTRTPLWRSRAPAINLPPTPMMSPLSAIWAKRALVSASTRRD